MNEKTEKQFVGHMLYHKEHGYSVFFILRKSALRYLILFLFFVLCAVLNRTGFLARGVFVFVAGLIVGAVARDVGWIRQGKKAWALYERVIDWAKVKEIADKDVTK